MRCQLGLKRRCLAGLRRLPGTQFRHGLAQRGQTKQRTHVVPAVGTALGAEVSLKDFRKDIIIEVYNEAGQVALAYKVYRCWVSEYQAMPDLETRRRAPT